MPKSQQFTSVQLNEFLQSEHIYLTNTQIKNRNILYIYV